MTRMDVNNGINVKKQKYQQKKRHQQRQQFQQQRQEQEQLSLSLCINNSHDSRTGNEDTNDVSKRLKKQQ